MSDDKPNILIIICDQLTQRAIGAYGSDYGATPNIDALAEDGITFSNSYTACPLCKPSRAAFWTGHYPHQTRVMSNGSQCPNYEIPEDLPKLGMKFKEAGYKRRHYGKTHDHGSLKGFRKAVSLVGKPETHSAWPVNNDSKCDVHTTKRVLRFLKWNRREPYIAVADLHNPHNICGYVGANEGPHEDSPIPTELPELPPNFNIDDMEKRPKPVQYVCCSHRRLSQAAKWNEENYRHYIAAYYHYTSMVDRQIGEIIDALKKRGDYENTLIVFMADHGDGMANHRMVTKQVTLYEETTRIPFIMAGPLVKQKGVVIEDTLVSLLDLFPTLCDVADIPIPEGLEGQSLAPFIRGEDADIDRDYVVSEWFSEWCFTISPGRMIRTSRYKYIRYLEGNGEELYDLENDPYETKTLHDDADYAEVMKEHRALLEKHIEETNDPFYDLPVKADSRWRSHPVGYQNHTGTCAPSADGNK